MNILYITNNASENSNSIFRTNALKRMGNNVLTADPKNILFNNLFLNKIGFDYFTGYKFIQNRINDWIEVQRQLFEKFKPDLICIDSGEFFGVKSVKKLKLLNCPVILLNNDDPSGDRDNNRFYSLRKAIPFYNYCFVVREHSVKEFKKLGCLNTFLFTRGYDELMHQKFDDKKKINNYYISDISFLGTWMRNENRDNFIYSLIKSGLNVSIWGSRWHKSNLWNKIKPFYKGGSIYGKEYVSAIQGSKISLGFLSNCNRDQITGRSYEIPYAGGLLCAQRTQKHLKIFKEGYEAFFWSDVNECISICRKLLADNELINKTKIAGYNKIISGSFGNEKVLQKIINQVFKKKHEDLIN
jgi:spore maturation protein CgeB